MVYENCIHCEVKGNTTKYYYCNAKRKSINVYNCTSCPLRIEKIDKNTIENFFKGFGGYRK